MLESETPEDTSDLQLLMCANADFLKCTNWDHIKREPHTLLIFEKHFVFLENKS